MTKLEFDPTTQKIVDDYRRRGILPAGAHPLPIPAGGAGDPDRNFAAPALLSHVRITADGGNVIDIPVTITLLSQR